MHASSRATSTSGSSGSGGNSHLAAELFKWMAKVDMTHVPYKGAAPALVDFISGQIQVLLPALPTVLPHIKAGRLSARGVSSAQRSASLPDVPTIAESGVPGYEATNWYALLAPARVPKQIVETLNSVLVDALARVDVGEAMRRANGLP